jgi:Zn-dependent protease with chaperone function
MEWVFCGPEFAKLSFMRSFLLFSFLLLTTVSATSVVAAEFSPEFTQWMQERNNVCEMLHRGDASCPAKIRTYAQKVLSCPISDQRRKEAAKYDRETIQKILKENPSAKVPAALQKNFAKLIKTTTSLYKNRLHDPRWSLKAYRFDQSPNAMSGVGGQILVNEALWEGPQAFDIEEATAAIAHEMGHVVQEHTFKLYCLDLELANRDVSLQEANEAVMNENVTATMHIYRHWNLQQQFEFEADRMAVDILKVAGFNTSAMTRVLEKLKTRLGDAQEDGTHPLLAERIQRLAHDENSK